MACAIVVAKTLLSSAKMSPDALIDTAYRFFGDAAIASMVSFIVVRIAGTRPGNIAGHLVKSLADGKVTTEEITKLKQMLGA